jgi:predicted PurR-regulated permease PerM
MPRAEFVRRSIIFISLACTPFLIWRLFDVILLATAAALVAALIHLVAEPFRALRLPRGLALAMSGLLLATFLLLGAYLGGEMIVREFQEVLQRAEEARQALAGQVERLGLDELFPNIGAEFSAADLLAKAFKISGEAFLAGLLAVFVGVFLACEPELYLNGLTLLLPPHWRANANDTLAHVAAALRLWLIGLLFEIVSIGLLGGVSVWLIGLPSPIALGAITGLAELVPYVGPIVAILPSVMVAATISPVAMLLTALTYFAIHQFDGNVLMPIIQSRLVRVPPALMLISIAVLGSLFGIAATILAAPITVILFVVVTKLYVRETLGENAALPGDSIAGD